LQKQALHCRRTHCGVQGAGRQRHARHNRSACAGARHIVYAGVSAPDGGRGQQQGRVQPHIPVLGSAAHLRAAVLHVLALRPLRVGHVRFWQVGSVHLLQRQDRAGGCQDHAYPPGGHADRENVATYALFDAQRERAAQLMPTATCAVQLRKRILFVLGVFALGG